MKDLTGKELAAVAVVGLVLTFLGRRVPLLKTPLALGTGMYIAGYLARGARPEGGWSLLDKAQIGAAWDKPLLEMGK